MRRLGALVVALSLLGPSTLSAQKPKKEKEKEKEKSHETQVTVVFSGVQREAARSYFVQEHGRGNCPPGLAKKHNGCLPPGQAKKRYVVGHPLPTAVVIQPLPPVLVTRLGPPPSGYQYAVVDGDVIKLAVGTRLVVDAITALLN